MCVVSYYSLYTTIFVTRLCQLKGFFVNRGYSENLVEGQISRVKNLNRRELIFKERNYDHEKSDRMSLVLNYHPALLNVHRVLKELHAIGKYVS